MVSAGAVPSASSTHAMTTSELIDDVYDDVSKLYNKIDETLLAGDNGKGLGLALFSSLLIGSSFIIKKRGLQQAGTSGVRAGQGGYSYLLEPLWWGGMITMILGEVCNFAAYAYAPAILVTPLGAMSIIVSTILADIVLKEKMHICGIFGCALCVGGAAFVIAFAPEERIVQSVEEIWSMAVAPPFATYFACVAVAVVVLIVYVAPKYGDTQITVYIAICSLMGSIGVMACKALGISIKLTLLGSNQFKKWETYIFAGTVAVCVVTQMNYLNKALDTYNTAIVSSIYYVFFTVLTIAASVIMYKDWLHQTANQISAELVGFLLIVVGVYFLHATKDAKPGCDEGLAAVLGSVRAMDRAATQLRIVRRGSEYMQVRADEDAAQERAGLLVSDELGPRGGSPAGSCVPTARSGSGCGRSMGTSVLTSISDVHPETDSKRI
mmetsp:Transcript_11918/g.35350  ORF Transcript_11918/g.35350 Transcript_11918/m.35350 type:complete len:438 (+) Transcript_11918:83-1396(+)